MLICKNCKGSNIEQKARVDPNDDVVLDRCSDQDIDDNWCRDCEEHVNFIETEENE